MLNIFNFFKKDKCYWMEQVVINSAFENKNDTESCNSNSVKVMGKINLDKNSCSCFFEETSIFIPSSPV